MRESRLDFIVQQAVAEGILPDGATSSTPLMRPWPVIVLTAVGGWLCSLPLLGFAFMLLERSFERTPISYFVALITIAVTISAMRNEKLPLFVEQLSIPLLLAACTLFGGKLWHDTSAVTALSGTALLVIGVALAVPYNWMRALMSGASCAMLVAALMIYQSWGSDGEHSNPWAMLLLALHLAVAIWAATQLFKPVLPTDEDGLAQALAIDAMSMGWGAVTLAGLALYAGSTFLSEGFLPGVQGGYGPALGSSGYVSWQAISALAAAGAAWHLAARWPSLRRPWAACVALVAVVLSFLMPSLGATLLILAMSATASRWTMAGAASVAAAWIIGAFYYQMSLPLATKAMIMVAAGLLLGASAWINLRGTISMGTDGPQRLPGLRNAIGIAVTAVAVLVVANGAIWQKERVLAAGQTVFIQLAPVDPRSLMQGDYMTLRIPVSPGLWGFEPVESSTGMAVGQIDSRQVMTISRLDDGTALAPGEVRIAIKPGGGSAVIVTDAFHFEEGDGARYAGARFGEFRLTANGQAVLVGLRGPNLEPL